MPPPFVKWVLWQTTSFSIRNEVETKFNYPQKTVGSLQRDKLRPDFRQRERKVRKNREPDLLSDTIYAMTDYSNVCMLDYRNQ